MEDHFDRNTELEERLAQEAQDTLFNEIRHIADMANIHFVRQKEIHGLGDAIYYARFHTGDEPFAVLLGDTIINSIIPVTQQLIDIYEQYQATAVAVEVVPDDKVPLYGIVGGEKLSDHIMNVDQFIENPTIKQATSNLAIVGRYILTPEIYQALEQTPRGKNNMVQLTDALMNLTRKEQVISHIIEGKRYDIGNKLDYLKTQVEYALRRKEFAKPFYDYLKKIVEENHIE